MDGALVLDGSSSFFSDPLPVEVKEKTLEVVVTLETLNQKAGGVLTVQDLRGVVFDSIVFAEKRRGEWLAGSNNFRRTRDFGGPPEKEATDQSVHLVIAYDGNGTIRCYRNGKVYGKPYRSSGPATFSKNSAQVVLGLRHGTQNGGNRNLSGMIPPGASLRPGPYL